MKSLTKLRASSFLLNVSTSCVSKSNFESNKNNIHPNCDEQLALRNSARSISSFKASQLQIIRCSDHEKQSKPDPYNITFGKNFTDHMLEIEWNTDGWSQPKICPLHNIPLHPSAKVLHYANSLFEGMKAYRGVDGHIRMFRPDMNMKRMNNSASRSCFPNFDGEELISCMSELIRLDQDFVFGPETKTALYIRPTMIATEGTLGVSQSNSGILFVILSPVGSYFAPGSNINSVNLLADPSYVRAWPGGTGDRKLSSNYGPTLKVQREALSKGLHQVLWLFGEDHQLTEIGTMNVFAVFRAPGNKMKLVTPPLGDGLILPGIVRDSILTLARTWSDVEVEERRFTMKEVVNSLKDGSLLEIFGAGTACVVTPVSGIFYMDQQLKIPTAGLSERLHQSLDDITYGRVTPHEWCRIVC